MEVAPQGTQKLYVDWTGWILLRKPPKHGFRKLSDQSLSNGHIWESKVFQW